MHAELFVDPVDDALAKVRDPRKKDQGLYDADYAAMAGLKFGIAIVVVHHLRKMDADDPLDQISGTTGLTGWSPLRLRRRSTSSVGLIYILPLKAGISLKPTRNLSARAVKPLYQRCISLAQPFGREASRVSVFFVSMMS